MVEPPLPPISHAALASPHRHLLPTPNSLPPPSAAAASAGGEQEERVRSASDMASAPCRESSLVQQSLTSRYADWVVEALEEIEGCFLITDPGLAGHPIVFASRGFLAMSGYAASEVLGRNGRIFQGPATDRASVLQIREAIREERPLQISLLNYRKDGSPHWILFHMFPVFRDGDGRVVHIVAVQVPIAGRRRRRPGSAAGVRGMMLGACRTEVRLDEELRCNNVLDSFMDLDNRGLECEESREASDHEKEKALDAANNILSALACCSKLKGRVVSGKRCNSASKPLSSSLMLSLDRIKQSFVLSDPHLPDMPIVYASDDFLSLTGYSRHEVLGQNCRFLNGPNTSAEALNQIKESIRTAQACTVCLLNYRKDASSFSNLLHISPVRNASGKIAFYVGVHIDVNAKWNGLGLSMEMRQLGAVGAVKVAVRSLSSCSGSSRPPT